MKTHQALLLSIVTITGLWTLSSCLSRQYHVVSDRMSWTDAQQHCRDTFTDLATVHTLEDVNTLDSILNPLEGEYWIGLYNAYDSWRWSLASDNDAEERKFRNWGPSEPNNVRGLCVTIRNKDGNNGTWDDMLCDRHWVAICFIDTDGERKYIRTTENHTWAEAQRECRKKHTDLASVRSHAENQEIQEELLRTEPRRVGTTEPHWIGLHRDSWKWSDGSSAPFTRWKEGRPNYGGPRLCAMIQRKHNTNRWNDKSCNLKASFVCYSQNGAEVKKQVLRVKLTIDSSLDMSGPAVPAAILEQLKQNMMTAHQGAPADIKVRWLKQADGRIFHKEDKKKKKREKKRRERKAVLTKREL